MNDETKKPDQTEATELSEQDLDAVSGGGAKDIEGVDVIIKKKPIPKPKGAA